MPQKKLIKTSRRRRSSRRKPRRSSRRKPRKSSRRRRRSSRRRRRSSRRRRRSSRRPRKSSRRRRRSSHNKLAKGRDNYGQPKLIGGGKALKKALRKRRKLERWRRKRDAISRGDRPSFGSFVSDFASGCVEVGTAWWHMLSPAQKKKAAKACKQRKKRSGGIHKR